MSLSPQLPGETFGQDDNCEQCPSKEKVLRERILDEKGLSASSG